MAKWANNNQAPKPGDQPPPFHRWALYRMRFIITTDLCAAWTPIGGLSAQLSNLSIPHHLADVELIAVALAYDEIHLAHLEESARARADSTLGPFILWTCFLRCGAVSRFRS